VTTGDEPDGRGTIDTMELIRQAVLTDPSPEDLWPVYRGTFPGRRHLASGPHPMSPATFHSTMTNHRIRKLLLRDRTRCATTGLAALADDPRDMPPTARSELAERWPHLLDQGRLWFALCLVVAPDQQCAEVRTHLIDGMWGQVAEHGGLVVVDSSRVADPAFRPPSALFHRARSFSPGATLHRVTGSRLWGYEFPAAITP
jgi:hypothetical protein